MHCNVTFVQETSEFFRTNNQWLCTCTAPQHVLQLQRFSHPSVLELIIDFACYDLWKQIYKQLFDETNNLSVLCCKKFPERQWSFMPSSRGNMNWPFILNPYLRVGCAGTFFSITREPYHPALVPPLYWWLYRDWDVCSADTYVVTGCFCIYELNMQLSWPCL